MTFLALFSVLLYLVKSPQSSLFAGKSAVIGTNYDFGPISQMIQVHLDQRKTDSVLYKHLGMRYPARSMHD